MFNRTKVIKPDRHINPDTSVLNIATFVLGKVNSFYDLSYDNLLFEVTKSLGVGAKDNFPYALNFLYLLGKIEYLEQTDSFRYNAIK